MKIIIIGASGTVGRAVVEALSPRHEIVKVGKTRGDFQVNVADAESVRSLFAQVGQVDAIVSVTGEMYFGPLADTTPEAFRTGIDSKLMGQVNLALIGQHFLSHGGSITLTSGIVSEEPIAQGTNATTINAAVEGFARGAAVDAWGRFRINVVNPTLLAESAAAYGPFFPGYEPVPASRVALAYVRSVEGPQSGRVYKVW